MNGTLETAPARSFVMGLDAGGIRRTSDPLPLGRGAVSLVVLIARTTQEAIVVNLQELAWCSRT